LNVGTRDREKKKKTRGLFRTRRWGVWTRAPRYVSSRGPREPRWGRNEKSTEKVNREQRTTQGTVKIQKGKGGEKKENPKVQKHRGVRENREEMTIRENQLTAGEQDQSTR